MKNVAYFFFVCITYLVVSIKQFNTLYAFGTWFWERLSTTHVESVVQ